MGLLLNFLFIQAVIKLRIYLTKCEKLDSKMMFTQQHAVRTS